MQFLRDLVAAVTGINLLLDRLESADGVTININLIVNGEPVVLPPVDQTT